jgi:hypothetical protein
LGWVPEGGHPNLQCHLDDDPDVFLYFYCDADFLRWLHAHLYPNRDAWRDLFDQHDSFDDGDPDADSDPIGL